MRNYLFAVAVTVAMPAAMLAGCGGSSTPLFYTLDATAAARGMPATRGTIVVNPVTVPAGVDQPQFVTDAGPNQVAIDEFNRWAAPLNDSIARVVAQNLTTLLGTPTVANQLPNLTPDYVVAIAVQRFRSTRGQGTALDAVWTVRSTNRNLMRTGRTTATEGVADDTFTALASAHSRELAKLSDDIAAAIQSEAEQR